jgi:hypothetical protein
MSVVSGHQNVTEQTLQVRPGLRLVDQPGSILELIDGQASAGHRLAQQLGSAFAFSIRCAQRQRERLGVSPRRQLTGGPFVVNVALHDIGVAPQIYIAWASRSSFSCLRQSRQADA